MDAPLKDLRLAQVGWVVKDIESAKSELARFLGVEEPPTVGSGDYEITKTRYRGEPAPEASCKMCFFDLPNVQLELIEPGEAPSAWREPLEARGEGLHHLAFNVKGMAEAIERCVSWGMRLIQRGEYGDGGGRYAYLDAEDTLHCVVELLESDA